jgi:glutamate decarboxylase
MSDLLDEYEAKTGHSVPIHGPFISAPFQLLMTFVCSGRGLRRILRPLCQRTRPLHVVSLVSNTCPQPTLTWDFKLPRVVSINTSGHKFGLAYVGVGWIIFRDKAHLPKDLIFELHYLGCVEYSFSLNFSRPAAPIIAQYFSIIHLGFEGYRSIALDDLKNARLLSRALENSGYYTVLSDIHRTAEGEAVGERGVNAKEYDEDVAVSCLYWYPLG